MSGRGPKRTANTYELIREAIARRRQVRALYKGRWREMCPHVLGYRRGREQALFFEFGGESDSGPAVGGQWRCLAAEELDLVEVREGEWYSGERESRPQSCVEVVDVAVAEW